MWFYVQEILIPHQRQVAEASGTPRGNLSDLYPRWLGSRELLLHHRDPYSPEVTREIQAGYYGRPLDPARPNDPKDQQGFVYPVYVALLLAPTATFPFEIVQPCFRWFLAILTGASVLMWLRALGWRPRVPSVAVIMILIFGSYAFAQGIKLQQLSLLVSGLMAGSIVLLSSGHLFWAGVLLALATIKPQLTAPLTAWLLLWTISAWKSRQLFVYGFVLAVAALVGGGELLLPGWIGLFRKAVSDYTQYTGPSLFDLLLGPVASVVAASLLLIAVASVCWKFRDATCQSNSFMLGTTLVLAATVVVIPMFAPYNQLLLLPGIFLAIAKSSHFRTPSRAFVSAVAIAVIAWPWLSATGLLAARAFLRTSTIGQGWSAPLYTSLAIPLSVLALLVLLTADQWRGWRAGI
jgi:Glycosyltransferase family 87